MGEFENYSLPYTYGAVIVLKYLKTNQEDTYCCRVGFLEAEAETEFGIRVFIRDQRLWKGWGGCRFEQREEVNCDAGPTPWVLWSVYGLSVIFTD